MYELYFNCDECGNITSITNEEMLQENVLSAQPSQVSVADDLLHLYFI